MYRRPVSGSFARAVSGRRLKWVVLAVWLVLVAVLGPLGLKLPEVTNDEVVLPGGSQSSQIAAVLRERFPGGDRQLVLVVYRRPGGLQEADRARILADARRAGEAPLAGRPIPPFGAGSMPGLVAPGGDVAVTIVPLAAGEVFRSGPSLEALRELDGGGDGLEVHVTGFPALQYDYNTAVKDADLKLLLATGALVLILLTVVYRSPVLAMVPLAVVGLAYAVASGVIYLLAQQGMPVDTTSTSLLLVLMFGAGTDYCLLLVARYRAELGRGTGSERAMVAAIPRAAPAMIASGLTVITALLVMLAGVLGVFRALGPVNAIGIAVVLVASLTLLPAILAVLGPRAFWPSQGAAKTGREEARWRRLGLRVKRQPAVWLLGGVLLLLVGVAGLSAYRTDVNIVGQFRTQTDSTDGFEALRASFPAGAVAPLTVLVERPDGTVRAADVERVRERLAAAGAVGVVESPSRSTDGRVAELTATFGGDPFAAPALERVQRIRDDLGGLAPELHVLAGRGSGERLDFRNAVQRDLRVLVPLVLLVILITLIVLLRALVAPLYLLATVVLSFLATLGASFFLFQHLTEQDGFDPALRVIVFIFLVALGSDYNIFLMSRVREEALKVGTEEGMLRALVATGPVITSAGIILAGTFAVLAVLPIWDLFDIGVAVALGVLIDTFLVRSILVPAITWIVGDRAWWPSSVAAGSRAAVVTGVYRTQQLLRVRRGEHPGQSD